MTEQVPPAASPTPPPDWATAPPPPQHPGWAVPVTPDKKTLGIWALVLCTLSFIPLAWLAGIGLAIAALVKSTNGRDFGKKYAIAALVVAALWMGAVLGLVAWGAISSWNEEHLDRDSSGAITEKRDATVPSLRVRRRRVRPLVWLTAHCLGRVSAADRRQASTGVVRENWRLRKVCR